MAEIPTHNPSCPPEISKKSILTKLSQLNITVFKLNLKPLKVMGSMPNDGVDKLLNKPQCHKVYNVAWIRLSNMFPFQ